MSTLAITTRATTPGTETQSRGVLLALAPGGRHATDGMLARRARVAERLPWFGGKTLDDAAVLRALVLLVFVPIRCIYPSRTPVLRVLTNALSVVWSAPT